MTTRILTVETEVHVSLDRDALANLIERWLLTQSILPIQLARPTAWLADDLATHIVEHASEWSRSA